jgi:hypothetical protein
MKWMQVAASLMFLTVVLPAFPSNGSFPDKDDIFPDSVDRLQSDSTTKKARTLFFGLTYGSNSSYLGRYQADVLPYYLADISYKSKTGLWLSLLAYDINNSLTFVDEVDVMAGWNIDLSKRVDASVFYTRYFFTESAELIKAAVANTASGSLGLDWSYLYTKITGHYIFGGTHDFFLVLDNSRYIEFPKIFRKDDYLSLEPKISIITGTQTFVDTHYINQGTPLVTRPGNGPPGGSPGTGGTPSSPVESSQTTFNILSYEFILPVAYNTGRFSFEINGRYSIPVNLLEGDTSAPQFFFTGGVLYYISSK